VADHEGANWVLGEGCALAAALCWSISLVLFKRSEATVTPQAMNLFKNVLACALLIATLPVIGVSIDFDRSQEDWWRLIASGVLGIAIADTLILTALRDLGAGLLAIVDTSYAPTIILFSVLVLGEPLGVGFLLGGALVLAGVVLAVSSRKPDPEEEDEEERPHKRRGVVVGVLGIVAMALGVVLAKPALERGHLVEVTLVRLIAGIVIQMGVVSLFPTLRRELSVFKPSPVWRTLVPASVLGSYLAMLLWLGGFKWTSASVASVLNQLSSVMTIGLAWLVLKERITGRHVVGALFAVSGAVVVMSLGRG
jgi:drug/metabolite transporter (DMT)-like permease